MIQTNRTLLIEEIAPNKENLISLIQYVEQRESLSDEEIKEIHQKLEVTSFEEVLEKFNPCIYMTLDTDQLQASFFRSVAPEMKKEMQTISVAKQMFFFDELVKLMENKRKHKYVLTSFQDFGASLIETPALSEFVDLRESIINEVAIGHRVKAEKILDELIEKYDTGIFLIKTFLEEASTYFKQYVIADEQLCFVIPETVEMQVSTIKVSEHFENNRYHTKEQEENYLEFLSEVLTQKRISNRKLMVLVLELCCKTREVDLGLLARYYEEYQEYYERILQNFWWEAKPLLEILLGIKSFFDSYSNVGNMPPSLVITNCTPEMLANNKHKNVFRIYLETMNEKNYHDKTIWYAIVPRIPFRTNSKTLVRERFASKGLRHTYQANDLEYVQVVLELLEKYHIQTFLSIIPDKDTIFHALVQKGLEEFEDSFKFLEKEDGKEFLIPCYPNFVIMPQEYTLISIGEKIKYDELDEKIELEEEKKLWLDEVIVEAAYVAAGLQAACQCPQYLAKFYPRNVRQDVTGVAYHLCEDNHNLFTTPQMFPEVMGYSEELHMKIKRYSKGIVFAPYKGKVIALTDRVYSYKQDKPDNIANIQTLTYMERIIRYESQDYKEHLIKEFFQSRPGSIISRWKDNSGCINGILKKEEQIEYSINEKDNSCTFKVRFRERNMEDVVKISR